MSPWAQGMLMILANVMQAIIDWQGPSPNSTAAKQVADLRTELEAHRAPLQEAEQNSSK